MTEEKQAVVNTKSGALEGFYQDGIYQFRGVPYAEPPVGPLRWLPPQPVTSWEGVRPVKAYGNLSIQVMNAAPSDSPGAPKFGDAPQSEDCLYLNIWTPGLDDAKRPVMLWIHGGGFIMGSGSESFMDRGVLASRGDVVIVSLNYRLGATGFINLNEITGGKIPASGNEGLLDQVAALEWIQENIAGFGGNPDNITIFGFSAGGMSVGLLLALPAARGKFHKANNRSGAANVISKLKDAVDISERYLDIFGLTGNDIDDIRDLTSRQLLDGQQELGDILRKESNKATPFQPVVDGIVMPEIPMLAIANGSSKGIPLMAGNTRDELKSMSSMTPEARSMDEAELTRRLNILLSPEMVPGVVNTYRSTRGKEKPVSPAELLGSINTDMMFRIPTIRLVEAQRDNGAKAYNYLFAYNSPAMGGALGAMHGLDNPFLFGALDAGFTGNGPEQQALAEKIQDSCIAFAHTGDPSCESAGKWPEYGQDRMTMIWDVDARVELAPFEEERQAWDKYDITKGTPI
ncbi:MAG: carboxylesterase/lipase family protein [Dehalococcoidales bacterium]|nr:carboxylesterase/lipase family protein [Dehalococcoidales bacterium]